tara:strand:+ start:188 stop:544 length:357 start_codon:yes stop_codon:yes gene_type:complete
MSTRAQIRFATREEGVTFNEHPDKIHAQFYRHTDGYPEGLGVDIAESLINHRPVEGRSWEIEELQTQHGDLDFIYYVWQKYDDSTWISIFEMMEYGDHVGECIFVGRPDKLIGKYKHK